MKKSAYLFFVLFALTLLSLNYAAQAQLYRWAISPAQVEMTAAPVVSNVLDYPNQNKLAPVTSQIANAMYDANNELLFYISDNGVYDKYSSLIGNITPSPAPGTGEVVIVPFGTNSPCQKKFNVFSLAIKNNYLSVIKSVLDMQNYTLTTGNIADQFPFQIEFGAMAVSRAIYGASVDQRYLYSIAAPGTSGSGGQVRRLTIENDGSTSNAGFFYSPPYFPNINCFTLELDLSPDGEYLLWASWLNDYTTAHRERYHLLPVNATGNYVQFDIPSTSTNNANGYRGVEFWQNNGITKLFLGAGYYGIYMTDLTQSYFTQVFSSNPDYGSSQIELSYNGKMYVASDNPSNVGLVNPFKPFIINPSMLVGTDKFTIQKTISVPPYVLTYPCPSFAASPAFYTLPDQIDGEDYSTNLSAPVTQGGSTWKFNLQTGGSVAWQYGTATSDNPWSSTLPVQIIKELRISNFTNLIISGMTFQFSPEAKVVVEPGSSLTLDNQAVLTSDYIYDPCIIPYTWTGVEVWGNTSASQFSANAQGKLTLINGSKIESTQWGARNWNSDLHQPIGGIIVQHFDR